ncbi:hypothetical protein KP509_12G067200 [Ceratopteris richardii]|uniref:Uncharacterized protein n=1 Tax=Ceratopteris richardii TaxID=49495 RepID=A0A8T2TQE6_CERRI|nr:hypothetical protein KP509_12G067200 [Ceratopteris richardii]
MLSLSNCAIKDSDWQDVEAQIQAELRALDAIDLTHISGDSQMEVLEKENATTAEHSTDQFENLMYRLELQNEKLLHFEHLIFIEETGFDESHRDMEKPASPNLDVSSPRNCRTQNCFLALENLIRPLCILDKEGNSCSKDAYIGPPVLSTKNTRFCKSPKGYRRRTVESPRKLRVQQLHGDNIENMQLSVYTSKTMKNVKDHEKSEEAENVKDHEKSGEAENVKDHEKSEEAENVKERLQDTVCLSHINVSFRGVEVINSNVKPQRRIPVASLPWKVNLVLKDPSLKAFWEAGILIRTCLQTSPYLKPIPFGVDYY